MTVIERAMAAVLETIFPVEEDSGWTIDNPEEVARAVLQAIREPSEGMVAAAADTPGMKAVAAQVSMQAARGYPLPPESCADGSPLEQAWKAMIDAALAE